MHYHCEVVMPPTDDVEGAVREIMKDFDESNEEGYHTFYDFLVIGGRYSGTKLMAKYEKKKIDEFFEWMKAEKVTVSGLQFGKQELAPASQIPKVDDKWNEMFPSEIPIPCPIFLHSNDQFKSDSILPGDIEKLKDIGDVKCERIIIAGPSFDSKTEENTGPPEPTFMYSTEEWNGKTWMKTDWDGKIKTALEMFKEEKKNWKDSYVALITPKDDWLVVTVDYHS